MGRNVLHDETKSSQITVALPGWRGNVRIQPTIEALLDEARPSTVGKGDQVIHGALRDALITAIIEGRWLWVHSALGRILGLDLPDGGRAPRREEATSPGVISRFRCQEAPWPMR